MADGTHNYQAARSVTVTTTGNIDNLDVDGVGMLLMNNASAAVIRGIAAGYHGKFLTVVPIGAGSVTVNHQDTNSSAANRIITATGDAITGLTVLQYDGVTARWRVIKASNTDWTAVPYNSGDYTGSGSLTWTVASGDVTDYSYKIIDGNTVILNIRIENTSISGTGNILYVALPAAIQPLNSLAGPALAFDNGTGAPAFFSMDVGTGQVQFVRVDLANWAAATDATSVYAVISYEI